MAGEVNDRMFREFLQYVMRIPRDQLQSDDNSTQRRECEVLLHRDSEGFVNTEHAAHRELIMTHLREALLSTRPNCVCGRYCYIAA